MSNPIINDVQPELRERYPEVDRFADRMRVELAENSHKGDQESWRRMSLKEAWVEISWHLGKLTAALRAEDTAAMHELAADIGNGAMMFDDILNRIEEYLRRTEVPEPSTPMSLADDPMRAPFQKKRPEPQGEPSDDYEAGYAEGFHHGISSPRGSARDDRVDGEPSDAQVDAAMEAFYGWVDATIAHPFRENMRAALRAAQEVR